MTQNAEDNTPSAEKTETPASELDRTLGKVNRRLRRLTISINLLTLFTILLVSITYFELGDYYSWYDMFICLWLVVAALVGFITGWFTRKLCEKP